MRVVTTAVPEPSVGDLDSVIRELTHAWTSTITIRRQSKDDVGYREIFVSIDGQSLGYLSHGDTMTREIPPGAHRLDVHNTLFRKQVDLTLQVGEHATFSTSNKEGMGTYSILAFLIGFLGAGPLYLTLERDGAPAGEAPSGS